MKNKINKFVGLLLLMMGPLTANADPIMWTLTDVLFDDGGTATGTFIYDAAENLVTDAIIETSAGSYSIVQATSAVEIAFISGTNEIDFTGETILDLLFIGVGLTDLGGIVAIGETENGGSEERICGNALCDIQDTLRTIIGGFVVAEIGSPTPVPEPGTLALFALGILGLGLTRKRIV